MHSWRVTIVHGRTLGTFGFAEDLLSTGSRIRSVTDRLEGSGIRD